MRRPLTTRGWGKYNRAYWEDGGYGDFVQWWAERMLPEPHSTKQIEDAVGWSLDTDGATLALSVQGELATPASRREQIALARARRVPGAGDPRDEGQDHPLRGRQGAGKDHRRPAGDAWKAPATSRTRASRSR